MYLDVLDSPCPGVGHGVRVVKLREQIVETFTVSVLTESLIQWSH